MIRKANQIYLLHLQLQTFILFTYGEMDTIDRILEQKNEQIKQLEEENKKLKSDLAYERTMLDNVKAEYKSLQNVIKKLKEKVRFLEECLDRKEKLNEKYRKELKSTYVYDTKQVRDIC